MAKAKGGKRSEEATGFRAPYSRRRERIALYGLEKVGKTTCVLQIAWQFHVTESNRTVYVIDTDYRAFYNTEEDWPELLPGVEKGEGPLVIQEVEGWEQITKATDEVVKRCRPGDVISVDLAGECWEEVQNWFSQRTFGMSLADYLQKQREQAEAEKRKGYSGFDQNLWWRPVKQHYRKWFKPLVTTCPAHTFFVAGTKNLSDDWDSAAVHNMYGAKGGGPGSKPDAEKHVGHGVNHILYLTRKKKKGEEKRELVIVGGGTGRKSLDDFAWDYLTEERGWVGYQDE